MIRRIYNWYLYRRYGVCPIHRVLCRRGGWYEPKWICVKCDLENSAKHERRNLAYENERERAISKLW